MKLGKWIILLLLLNLGVLAVIAWRQEQEKNKPSTAAPAPVKPSRTIPLSPEVREVIKTHTLTVTNQFSWGQLETEDYHDYIARLRAINCPEDTIRDLIIADVEKALAPRLRELYPYRTNRTYWQPEEEELLNNVNYREISQQERALDLQKRQLVKELTGADLFSERLKVKGQTEYYDRRLGFLPEEKRSAVREMIEKYHDLDWSIREKQWQDNESLSPDDRANIAQLRAQKNAELTRLLTPDERAQLDLWLSPSSDTVRHDLYGMNATETEFNTVYKLRKQFDESWDRDTLNLDDLQVRAQYNLAKQQLNAQVHDALGEERYAQYQRGQDPDFHELNSVVSNYGLPPGKATEVYGIKQALLAERQKLNTDPGMTVEQKQAILSAINEETQRTIIDTLGARAAKAYLRNADWLKR